MTFPLGQIVATRGVLDALLVTGGLPDTFLARHAVGDWGDVSDEDRRENDLALVQDLRILSAYTLSDGTKIWIITEADRSSTCVLLPDEY